MKKLLRESIALALTAWLSGFALASAAMAQGQDTPALLQIAIIEGEGSVHPEGSRSPRLITVQVTGEAGRPVQGAAVSFKLPEDGPSGTFAGGLKTAIVISDANGRATAPGVQWNRTAGNLQIRIIAAKGQARAGAVSAQYLGSAEAAGSPTRSPQSPSVKPQTAPSPSAPPSKRKWILLGTLAAGAAAAGLAIGLGGGTSTTTPSPQPRPQIGAPTITVGRP